MMSPLMTFSRSALAEDGVIAGEFVVEPATLHCLGFEWSIRGDDNHNASVDVQYRKQGQDGWRQALPLLRIGDEKVWRSREFLEHRTPRMFAGSILDLEPDTEYECRLTMADPNGVLGRSTQMVSVRTRGVPQTYEGGRVLHVYPPDYTGPRQEPSFTGLKEAYYGPGLGDWSVVRERKVRPGDIIEVHAGLYKADYSNYIDPLQTPFHGTYVLTVDGTPEKPVVIRAAGDGEVIFDGNGAYRLFDVMAADYSYFEGLTIRNTDVAFYTGLKDVLGCSGLVVRNCRMENVGIGVMNQYAGSKDFYIADNVLIGRDDSFRLIGWSNPGIYGPSALKSYYGIKVYGQGHVICHNYVAYFHDGICVCTHGPPEQEQSNKSVAIDIYNNDIFLMVDDFIETDGGTHNIRVMRNRGFNAAHHGLSAQPLFGGPAYFLRNLVYNVPLGGAVKYGGANPAGVLVYHNTFIAENRNAIGASNVHYRNNLFLGTDHPEKAIFRSLAYSSYTTFDYNGYRPNQNDKPQFWWKAPSQGTLRNYELHRDQLRGFDSLADFRQATGQEMHGLEVDYDIFRKCTPPDASQPHAVYRPEDYDFRLCENAAAVDAGVPLPNVNDNYTGAAPDLGALETGQPMGVYGPRTRRKW
jgi:hypothetical protein